VPVINYSAKEINYKIVYYGPGLGGKTTNLQYLYAKTSPESRGKFISLATESKRTLFFDFLPIELMEIKGFKVRFHLYSVPGQSFYNESRKLILKGLDGVIFVADSQVDQFDANIESLEDLRQNLKELNIDIQSVPTIIQYNKRDLNNILTVDDLQRELNKDGFKYFEAVSTRGEGVFETFKSIVKLILKNFHQAESRSDHELT
jgi:signal recognition particle receptor subunit beta